MQIPKQLLRKRAENSPDPPHPEAREDQLPSRTAPAGSSRLTHRGAGRRSSASSAARRAPQHRQRPAAAAGESSDAQHPAPSDGPHRCLPPGALKWRRRGSARPLRCAGPRRCPTYFHSVRAPAAPGASPYILTASEPAGTAEA